MKLEVYNRKNRSDQEIVGMMPLTDKEFVEGKNALRALLDLFEYRNFDESFLDRMDELVALLVRIKMFEEEDGRQVGLQDSQMFDEESRPSRISDLGKLNLENMRQNFHKAANSLARELELIQISYQRIKFSIVYDNTDIDSAKPFLFECLIRQYKNLGAIISRMKFLLEHLNASFFNIYEPLVGVGKSRLENEYYAGLLATREFFRVLENRVHRHEDWTSRNVVGHIMDDLAITPFAFSDLKRFQEKTILDKAHHLGVEDVKIFQDLLVSVHGEVIDAVFKRDDQIFMSGLNSTVLASIAVPMPKRSWDKEAVLSLEPSLQSKFDEREYMFRFLTSAQESLPVGDVEEIQMLIKMHKLYRLDFIKLDPDRRKLFLDSWNEVKAKIDAVIRSLSIKKMGLKKV
ncbi:hypothetical protein IT412_00190 [Candidatus Peregrinibacteria bacterium]|nr:hypothetical protein [Candidatus Peregrinibacteria bacterium]